MDTRYEITVKYLLCEHPRGFRRDEGRRVRAAGSGVMAQNCRPISKLGRCRFNLKPFVECKDMRLTEPSSERYRRIRLRHAAAGSDLVAMSVRVSSRLRLPVA